MGIAIDPARLDREMARRGWNAVDLARAAGLSAATIAAARAGRPMSPRTLEAIARALATKAPVEGLDQLLA